MTKDNPVAAGAAKYANDGANKHYCSDRAVSEMLSASPVQAGIDPLVAEIEAGLTRHAVVNDEWGRVVAGQTDNMRQAAALLRSQAERIAALEVERDGWKQSASDNLDEWQPKAEAAESLLAEAREALEAAKTKALIALEPFAKIGQMLFVAGAQATDEVEISGEELRPALLAARIVYNEFKEPGQ